MTMAPLSAGTTTAINVLKIGLGATVTAGAVGGGIGAWQGLGNDPAKHDGLSGADKRETARNGLVGAAGGLVLGVAASRIPIEKLPFLGSLGKISGPVVGAVAGAVAVGAFTAAKNYLD